MVRGYGEAGPPPTDLRGRTGTLSPCSPPWRCSPYQPAHRPRRASQSVTTVNGPGSMRKERPATATATIVFDGSTLVDGAANFPFPAPFIRVDTEK